MNCTDYFANPTQVWSEEDILTTDRYKAIAEKYAPHTSYTKTDVFKLGGPIRWRGQYHTYTPAPIWLSGHSDYGITPDIYNKYKHNCSVWFTLNKETDTDNLFALPLGRTNNTNESHVHPILGDTAVMCRTAQEPKHDTNLVYMNFSIGTYPQERQPVFDMFKDKSWVTVGQSVMTHQGSETYLHTLRNHTFALCPRGNGLDTHRLWEALYMGSIPIVRRHFGLREFEDLPICWIDNWAEVTPEFLESERKRIMSSTWNFKKLTIGYWDALIAEKIKNL
jgi:hypothetical protein